MTVLENWKEAMQVEMVTRLMEQVCDRINLNTEGSLPKLGKVITDLAVLKATFDRKVKLDAELQKQKEESGTNSFEMLRKT